MKRVIFSVSDSVRCQCAVRSRRSRTTSPCCAREIAKQEVVIAQLLKRIEALEKQPPPPAAMLEDLQDDIKAQEDSINSLRETVNSKVNLNGYYNFRFSADGSEEPMAFQQHHLGVMMAKQLGKFNFLMELELQNVPHHAEIAVRGRRRSGPSRDRGDDGGRPQRRRTGRGRERVDGIQSQPLPERSGRQAAVPAVLVAEPLSEPDAVDHSSDLPARVVPGGADRRHCARVGGAAGRPVRVRRRLQVLRRQQQLRGQQPRRLAGRQIVGSARRGSPPDWRGVEALRRRIRCVSRSRRVGRQRRSRKTTSSGSNRSSRCRSFSCRQNGRAASRSTRRARDITCSRPIGSTKTGSRSIASSSSRAREFSAPSGGIWRG